MTTKAEQKVFKFIHPISGDQFWYIDKTHQYLYWENKGEQFKEEDMVELPGTTTPLKLVNELSWDANGNMTDKSFIIQQWAIKCVVTEQLEKLPDLINLIKPEPEEEPQVWWKRAWKKAEEIILEAKKAPNKKFTGAGISGTEIHAQIEKFIKECITKQIKLEGFFKTEGLPKQVENFIVWAYKNKVKFLFSEEPIYSKEWMNCGTVDFICEIDGKILIGDIKTNGDKRRYEWNSKTNQYDFNKPVSDIHVPALWQTGCYGKMATEDGARKLIDKFDGIVIVNIKKSGEFDEKLDVRYDYNTDSLIRAYNHVIGLYREFAKKI